MNVLLIMDKDSQTDLSENLKAGIVGFLEEKGHRVDVFELGKNDVFQCIGCLICLTKHPDECVNKDIVNEIKKNVKKYSATFYLTPVLFGHYSSTMASAINKGTGSHNWQVIIGFGEDIDDEEKSTFIDLTAKHRGKADIVHPGMDVQVDVFVSQSVEDNEKICAALEAQCEIML
ncbi:MAG: NAD(P)H-dependent oxidoreductase [Dehalococcoidales bacterium]|nr:NAD(P)H-dependent oxidoreductase [Dehalococcoidales bacterium]